MMFIEMMICIGPVLLHVTSIIEFVEQPLQADKGMILTPFPPMHEL